MTDVTFCISLMKIVKFEISSFSAFCGITTNKTELHRILIQSTNSSGHHFCY
jgi:hypothetical protein